MHKKWLLSSTALILLAACALPSHTNLPLQQPLQSQLHAQNQATLPKPEVREIPSPNAGERPENTRIDTIVLHHTAMAGDAEAVGRFFARPSAQVSAHYVVDRSGYIVQSVADDLRAWHAGRSQFQGRPNVNNYSIGIEICNLGDSVEPYPDSQYDAIIHLVAWLVQHYQIPLENITRHRDVAVPAGRKIDTSDNFSVPRVVEGVKALLNGTYQAPPATQLPQLTYSSFRTITVQRPNLTFEDLADIYLDIPSRAVEIAALNPQWQSGQVIPQGAQVRLPNDLSYYQGR